MALWRDEFEGRVIITWPRETGGLIHCATITFTDADTGETITSAMDVTVRAELDKPLVAEMTMLTGDNDKPLPPGAPVVAAEDGSFRSGTFRWLVAGMSIAD